MEANYAPRYIKELAERINSLEANQVNQANQPEMQYPAITDDTSSRAYQELSPTMDEMVTRKRTFSMSEGMSNAFMQQGASQRPGQAGGWPGQGTENTYSSPLLANGSAKVAQPFWSQDSDAHEQAGESADANMALAGGNNTLVDIDEKSLDMYVYLPLPPAITL